MGVLDALSYKYAPAEMAAIQKRIYAEKQAKKMADAAEQVYGSPDQPETPAFDQSDLFHMPGEIGYQEEIAKLSGNKNPGIAASGVFDMNVPPEQRYNLMQKRMAQTGLQGYIDTAMANAQNMQSSSMSNLGAYQRKQLEEKAKSGTSMQTDDTKEYEYYVNQATAANQTPDSFYDWQIKMRRASVPQAETDPFLVSYAKNQATAYDEMAKSAVSGIEIIDNLNNMKTVQNDSLHGGLAEAGKQVGNMLASVGVTADWITATNLTERASNDILRGYMVKLGARGLTDKDMDILRSSLPTFKTDKHAQSEIIRIIKKGVENNINDYATMSKRYSEQYPNNHFSLHPAVERYQKTKGDKQAVIDKFFNPDGTPKRSQP